MDIVKEVIEPYGLSMSDETEGTQKPLDYCTQYDESDFAFISRITEQHGILYWFQHDAEDNRVAFGNSRTAYDDCPLVDEVKFHPQTGEHEEHYLSILYDLSVTASMISGKYTHWDYDFRTFKAHEVSPRISASPYGNNVYEVFNYPAGEEGYVKDSDKQLTDPDHATGFIDAVGGANDAASEVYRGSSSARSLCAGYTFEVTDHPRDSWNRKYLLTEVQHRVEQAPSYRTGANVSGRNYSNRFRAISSDLVYRPPVLTPRPRIFGPQTALVVGAPGEEIHVDKYGRICVQFFWDRARKPNTIDSTWVRVAQPWAGNGRGVYFWPRAGDEVIIQFLNGDPDNPVVLGSLYNGTNMPPETLPGNSTRSGILTRSSKGGSAANANELRFEDKKGSEQVYIHAEKDMDESIEHDLRRSIGGQDSLTVGGSQFESIGSEAHRTISSNLMESVGGSANIKIGGDHLESIGGNLSLSIGASQEHQVGQNLSLTAGQNISITGGQNIVITGMQISLVGAGGFITIGPSGVAIQGAMVLINSGGSAGSGTAAQTTDPDKPKSPAKAEGAS